MHGDEPAVHCVRIEGRAGRDGRDGLVVGYATPPGHAYVGALDAMGRALPPNLKES
jgi:hypothetical protein